MTPQDALRALLHHHGADPSLAAASAVAIPVDDHDVVIEYVQAGHFAVHAAMAGVTNPVDDAQAAFLMMAHLAGAGTRGCSFWLTPDRHVRVGLCVLGPDFVPAALADAVERVASVALARLDHG
jgi:prephenate dehydrogenase